MFHSISVDSILARTTERARFFYTHMVTMPGAWMDFESGWSSHFATQSQVAESLGCSVTTAERAIRDLREVAVCRVFAWPGAVTETQLRVADVKISSPFGPVMRWLTPDEAVDAAIRVLNQEWEEIQAQSAGGGN